MSHLLTRSFVVTFLLSTSPLLWGEWTRPSAPFQSTAISQNENSLWICGPDASIASSADGGEHWDVRNSKAGAGTLLSIRWNNSKVGAAGGAGGLVLLTTDGGVHWKEIPTSSKDAVLDVSFADEDHGIALLTSSVIYTADAGKHWSTVLPSTSAEQTKFRFVLALAALDKQHAAVLVKEGPAQYYDSRLVTTSDAGATWRTNEIEHTTLDNLLVVRELFWLVGTEVIDRANRGGHAVPVTFHSTDGVTWDRGSKPLIDTNNACRPEGCLMWNGAFFNPFVANGAIYTFPPAKGLSTRWAATDKRICFISSDLECNEVAEVKTLPEHGAPSPDLAASALQPTTPDSSGKCIRCDYPRILVNEHFEGKARVQLTVMARSDGTVSSVDVVSSPRPEIGEEVAAAARTWIFYPATKDGLAVPTKRTPDLTVTVIKPR